jgi:hypothetical protein
MRVTVLLTPEPMTVNLSCLPEGTGLRDPFAFACLAPATYSRPGPAASRNRPTQTPRPVEPGS